MTPSATPSTGDETLHSAPINSELSPRSTPTGAVNSSHVASAKRGRKSRPKVKTGCNNCKQRRIKCDEKRPAPCTPCLRSKKECSGYPPPPRAVGHYADIRIAPKPLQQATPQTPSISGSGIIKKSVVLPPRRVNRKSVPGWALQKRTLTIPSPRTLQPGAGLPLSDAEGQYFNLFRVHTASELCGYFDSVFWAERVLQECHNEAAIRHAALALGALYKTLEQSHMAGSLRPQQSVENMDSAMLHWQVAVRQYSDACKATMLVNSQSKNPYRTRLMASVLLSSFDSFIGDHKQAITQIQSGLGLLQRMQDEQIQNPAPTQEYIEEVLIDVLTRVAIQAKSYDLAFHFPEPYVVRLTGQVRQRANSPTSSEDTNPPLPGSSRIPHVFTSLREARLACDHLDEKILFFLEGLQFAPLDGPRLGFPQPWAYYGPYFRDQLEAWSRAYEPVLASRTNPGIDPSEKAAIAALKMFQLNTKVLLSMIFIRDEAQFDLHEEDFKIVVDLGLEIVSDDENRAVSACCPHPGECQHRRGLSPGTAEANTYIAHHIRPSFSPDQGIVPSLFVVATKCRHPTIRRRAIQLLRSCRRREGMWDSELASRLGQWIMETEEAEGRTLHNGVSPKAMGVAAGPSISPPPLSEAADRSHLSLSERTVPHEKRLTIKSVDFDLRARFAALQVGSRSLATGPDDPLHQATSLTW